MAFSHILTLVVDRSSSTLSANHIAIACDIVKGRMLETLSEGEAVAIACPNLNASAGANLATVRAALSPFYIDVFLTPKRGQRKGLLIADMDSTIVSSETLDDLAAEVGIGEKIAHITSLSMNGELDFIQAIEERVALLKNVPARLLEITWARHIKLNEGAQTLVATMRAHNAYTALVSGGFTWFTERVASLCGFHEHHANILGIENEKLTGRVVPPILDKSAKLSHLERLAHQRNLRMSATASVGDGANDIAMLQAAGLGVGFHPKPIVQKAVEHVIRHTTLRSLLFIQGYSICNFIEP